MEYWWCCSARNTTRGILAVPCAVCAGPAVVERVVVLLDVADAIREAGPACAAAGGVGLVREAGGVVRGD